LLSSHEHPVFSGGGGGSQTGHCQSHCAVLHVQPARGGVPSGSQTGHCHSHCDVLQVHPAWGCGPSGSQTTQFGFTHMTPSGTQRLTQIPLSFANSHVCSCGGQIGVAPVLAPPLLAEMSSDDCPVGELWPDPQPKTKSVPSAKKVEATTIDFMNVSFRALRDPNRSRVSWGH
jgi:hypothetical protein